MEGLKRYLIDNFEQIFVLIILLSVAGISYFIPYKLAFLNFYFIPILLAAYYLGVRKALLGGSSKNGFARTRGKSVSCFRT